MNDKTSLMLLDTYGLVYRAFFALPGLTTSAGVPINAVYGFTMMLTKLLADEKPTHVIAAFEAGTPGRARRVFKNIRPGAAMDELRSQFRWCARCWPVSTHPRRRSSTAKSVMTT